MLKNLENLIDSNRFYSLGSDFYSKTEPSGISNPALVSASKEVARLVGLEPGELDSEQFTKVFSGHELLNNSNPLAMVYSGHQFGSYNPRLGDGRSLLLGDSFHGGSGWEISLKGGGLTPYSRFADGRAVLRSSIREYLCSEAMAGLGIPTTRALCVIHGDDKIVRETIEPSATVVRVAETHIRFGSFEYFFHSGQGEQVRDLADYVIEHYFPELAGTAQAYRDMLAEVSRRTARTIARWQSAGFAHGVMNTDNMSIIGDTLDYGPFGFMEEYDPSFICNHSDHTGRYAFNQQPQIGLWNLNALAQAFVGLVEIEDLKQALEEYEPAFLEEFASGLRGKLGLQHEYEEDFELVNGVLDLLAENRVDYTIFFRRLCDFRKNEKNEGLRDLFLDRDSFDAWAKLYSARLQKENSDDDSRSVEMKKVNPKYILRNYMAQVAIDKAHEGDYSEVNRLLEMLYRPFDEQPENEEYAGFPPEWSRKISVSCSS